LFCTERAYVRGVLNGRDGIDGSRVAIQGFGNAGAHAAKLFQEAGAVIIAVSDSQGGVGNEHGLDLAAIRAHKAKMGTVVGAAHTRNLSNDELLALDCDILIP